MDFFQGSSPPNFISFCLEHQNVDEPQVQSNTTTGNPTGPLQRPVPISMPSSVPSPPPFPPVRAVPSQTMQMAVDSPFSNESNIDVTTYADEMVQRMEISQGLIGDDLARHDEEGPFTAQVPAAQATIQDPEFVRSSTPNPSNQSRATVVSLSQLESSLSVVSKTQADLPELQVNQDQTQEVSEASFLQSEENASSSVIEPPPLPGRNEQTIVSGEHSDTKQTLESASHSEIPALYGTNPFDSVKWPYSMALTNQAFGITASGSSPPVPQPGQSQGLSEEGTESAEKSSLDATLSEVRNRSPAQKPRQGVVTAKSTRAKRGPKRGVPMREEFFSNIRWTRSFISGPYDPLHNPHMVWCHMCKKNFSIKTKGTVEILRHHRTEKHLRRDQSWRYEHLRTTDSVTGKIQHRVRGRNGKILNKSELAHELPKFIHTELIDVGERSHFMRII